MKKSIAALITSLLMVGTTQAHNPHHYHQHQHHQHRNYNWVAPVLGGMLLGAVISNANTPIYRAPPTIVQPLPQPRYYDCLVQVYDPYTNTYRNEVRTCIH